MKTLILTDQEFTFINKLFTIAYHNRHKMNDNPIRKFVGEIGPIVETMDESTRRRYNDMKREMEEHDAGVLRELDSIKKKLMVLENQNDQ